MAAEAENTKREIRNGEAICQNYLSGTERTLNVITKEKSVANLLEVTMDGIPIYTNLFIPYSWQVASLKLQDGKYSKIWQEISLLITI